MLPERVGAKGPAQHLRGRPRCCSCARQSRSLWAIVPRPQRVEMLFAHLKRILRLGRLRLRPAAMLRSPL